MKFRSLLPVLFIAIAIMSAWALFLRFVAGMQLSQIVASYGPPSTLVALIMLGLAVRSRADRMRQLADVHSRVDSLRGRATELIDRMSSAVAPNCGFAWLLRGGIGWSGTENAWRLVRDMPPNERARFFRLMPRFALGMQHSGGDRGARGTELIDLVASLESVMSDFDFWCRRLRELRPDELDGIVR